jgi:FixJ family two-component response regulator
VAGGVPVILMSGEPDRIAALSSGPHPFLAKPFRAAALLDLIAKLLG